MKAARFVITVCVLLLATGQNKNFVSGLYADEPLLYDSFPAEFIWATATSAYQVYFIFKFTNSITNMV